MWIREQGGDKARPEGAVFCEGRNAGECVTAARGSIAVGLGAAWWPEGGHRLSVHRGERGFSEGQGPTNGDEKREPCGTDRGLASSIWVSGWLDLECGLCMRAHVCECDLPLLPMTVDGLRLPGPAREGITFWFSRLNDEVSVN